MTTLERLENWKQVRLISDAQCATLSALVRKERFSVFLELNALLYIGVISFVGGVGWTVTAHSEKLGDVFILTLLSAMFGASLYYCFSRGTGYSNSERESPNFIFDYLLYLACLLLSVELGYIEFRFEWLRDAWDNYLLFCSIVFLVLAYRFDNRFVLSLGLSSLAAWFGIKVTRGGFMSSEPLRFSALVYAFLIAVVGTFMYRQGIKKHFLETYLHIAINVTFLALLSGLSTPYHLSYLSALLVVAGATVLQGGRLRRFVFVVYGIVFGYIGLSVEVLRLSRGSTQRLLYLVTTGSAVILLVAFLARRAGRDE